MIRDLCRSYLLPKLAACSEPRACSRPQCNRNSARSYSCLGGRGPPESGENIQKIMEYQQFALN